MCILGNDFDAAGGCAATASDAGEVRDGSVVVWVGYMAPYRSPITKVIDSTRD